jgi:hypothetical protein
MLNSVILVFANKQDMVRQQYLTLHIYISSAGRGGDRLPVLY